MSTPIEQPIKILCTKRLVVGSDGWRYSIVSDALAMGILAWPVVSNCIFKKERSYLL
jgi:hypothetical protein